MLEDPASGRALTVLSSEPIVRLGVSAVSVVEIDRGFTCAWVVHAMKISGNATVGADLLLYPSRAVGRLLPDGRRQGRRDAQAVRRHLPGVTSTSQCGKRERGSLPLSSGHARGTLRTNDRLAIFNGHGVVMVTLSRVGSCVQCMASVL